MRRLLTAASVVAMVFCVTVWASAATRYDPRLKFRVLRTAHFSIYWHQGEEAEAERLAAIAEEVRAAMQADLGVPPSRVHVIVVDQSDLSNGWATPVPWDAIEITARPPALSSSIGNTTDWLRLVFTHEYTHILHLDRTRGIMRGVRDVFGRVPVAFSNAFLPVWQVEGIATFEESRHTGEGRVPSGDFRMIVDGAARAGKFESYTRVAGGLDEWPAGNGSYAYGAYFHQYLADRFGPDRIGALRDATAARLPYFGAGAFRRVFGESLGDLWTDFRTSRRSSPTPHSETDAQATQLTHHHFEVTALTASNQVFYAATTPDGYPSLMRLTPGRAPERLAWRYAGDRTTVHGTWVVFDQVAPVRSVAWYSDLYAVSADGGQVHRLTRETRAAEPAFSPDGTRLACVVERAGHRALATMAFEPGEETAPTPLIEDAESDYGAPQWSADGAHLVAERRHDGRFEIVEIDVAARSEKTLFASTTRLETPVWIGADRILFAAELPGEPSNVFAIDLVRHTVRRVTDSVTGAREPRLSTDAKTLYYIGYTPEGSEVFSVPTDERGWQRVDAQAFDQPRPAASPVASLPPAVVGSSAAYSPWDTLRPTYWTPVMYTDATELNLGAGTAMTDVLGFHAYAAQAAWSSRARPDWSVSYAYDRWRPTLFANYSDDTDPVRGGEIRSAQFQGGALLPLRHLRRTETVFGAIDLERDSLTCDGPCRTRATTSRRSAVQAGWLHDTRRLYGYSISAEEGHSLSAAVESTADALGSDVSARAAVLDARAYHRAGGQHRVLAVRGAVAMSWGATDDRRVFSAAGSGPAGGVFSFDRDSIGLLRGFSPDDVVATRAAVLNADFRFPVLRPERGAGVLPVFVRAAHAAIFVDAGTAWDAAFHAGDLRTSMGGELSLDVVLGHYLPVTFSGGAAWTHDPVNSHAGGAIFGRIGRAF